MRLFFIIGLLFLSLSIYPNELEGNLNGKLDGLNGNELNKDIKYPFVYIPGMFDNGDLLTKDNLLIKETNGKDGFYYKNYFSEGYNYDDYEIFCGSNIIGSKYNRISVANLIREIRTNISIYLMAQRLYSLIEGKAPNGYSYSILTNHKGNDYFGFFLKNNIKITYFGLREEIWAKYGKKVFYKNTKNGHRVSFEETPNFYINENGYFSSHNDIKFNFIVHSSGGLAIREYMRLLMKQKNRSIPVKNIINLSVPQKGASMLASLHKGFTNLIEHSTKNFYENRYNKNIKIETKNDEKIYSYKELIDSTNIHLLYGDNPTAKLIRFLLSEYILFFIPFDGQNRVLGNDPALFDLNPNHLLVKTLNKTIIPEDISIYNYRVKSAYAPMFQNIGKFLNLSQNDGVVDYRDTSLEMIPNYKDLNITDIQVESANHIPLPYIKPLFELRETIQKYYSVLGLLLKKKMQKEDAIDVVYALFTAIMVETGLDLNNFLANENYSVIDYFAENPVMID